MNQPTKLNPCRCGSTDLIVWWPVIGIDDRFEQLASMEKIQCGECGRVVYGSDEEAIKGWNNQEYCDESTN